MTKNNDCQDRHEAIAALVLGELEIPAADEIKKHMDACRNCRSLYQALTEEEEIVRSAFNAIDERSRVIEDSLVAQFGKGSRVCEDIVGKLPESQKTETAHHEPNLWRTIMKSKTIRFTAAAVIMIACVIGVSLWRSTSSGIALADVLARVDQVKAFRCKGSWTMNGQIAPGKPYRFETRYADVMSQEYGYKSNVERPDPNSEWMPYAEFYVSPQKKTFVQIAHTAKKYVRAQLSDEDAQQRQKELSQYIEPGALLKDIMACKYETLGRSTIDGVVVEGFRTTDPNCRSPVRDAWFKDPKVDVKVWISVKTRLPVRYEDLTSGLDQRGNTISQRFVVHDFEWDVPVTAAEFEPPPIPDGYAVVDNPPGLDDEETAIQGLKRCVELFGNYLETISDDTGATGAIFLAFEKSETPTALRLKEEVKGLTGDEKLNRVSSAGGRVRRLIWFYVRLVQDKKDPAYYGKTVTPKDADKVLLRWKVSDNKYRVIFGDLSAETVTSEKLAALEMALPK